MIKHMAVFSLVHPHGSAEEAKFLDRAHFLATRPGVKNFSVWSQTSRQADYDFAIAMEFDSVEAFRAYMMDHDHLTFAFDEWYPHVAKTMDVNFEPLPASAR